jgi:thiamine biosynthesis lipoprotein
MKFSISLFLLVFIFNSCSTEIKTESVIKAKQAKVEIFGNTQGTTYSIIINDEIEVSKKEIDSLLHSFDMELSTYEDSSFVSKFNQLQHGELVYYSQNKFFANCLNLSDSVYSLSNGLFDPSIMPLVDSWSFFKKNHNSIPDSITIDSLKSLVSFENGKHFMYSNSDLSSINKVTPGFKLDFNAIAQGYSVDVLYDYLINKGANSFYVEIGGELRVYGNKSSGDPWTIGIDKPNTNDGEREVLGYVNVNDRALATSGNYRKFYVKDGVKYSHTINPKTGYPVQHSLLSATVVADNCALADAFATQFMVMGIEKSMQFVKDHPELNLAVYFIFNNNKGRMELAYNQTFGDLLIK